MPAAATARAARNSRRIFFKLIRFKFSRRDLVDTAAFLTDAFGLLTVFLILFGAGFLVDAIKIIVPRRTSYQPGLKFTQASGINLAGP